MHLAMYMLSSN